MSNRPRARPKMLLRERTRHGKFVWYVRVGKGPRVRLTAAYNSNEFWAQYWAAVGGDAPPAPPAPVAASPKPPRSGGVVYFVRAGDLVKIGFTADLDARLASIATHAPAPPVVLLTVPGTVLDERAYHDRFEAHRAHREWFRLEGELADFIRERTL